MSFYKKLIFLHPCIFDNAASWVKDNGSDAGGVPQLQGAKWCTFEELKRGTDNFSEECIIGSGGYGKVSTCGYLLWLMFN